MRATEGRVRGVGWAAVAAALVLAAPGAAAAQMVQHVSWHTVKKGVYITGGAAYSYAQDLFLRGDNIPPEAPMTADIDYSFATKINVHSRQSYSAGVGYYLTDTLRAELTFTNRQGYKGHGDSVNDDTKHRCSGNHCYQDIQFHSVRTEGSLTQTLMLTLYKDLPGYSLYGFTPYVGLGVGYGRNKMGGMWYTNGSVRKIYTIGQPGFTMDNQEASWYDAYLPSNTTYTAAFQVAAGFEYSRSDNMDFTIEYRYAHLGDLVGANESWANDGLDWMPNKDSPGGALRVHEVSLGTKYNF